MEFTLNPIEGLMVESMVEWNSHLILFDGFIVESAFEWNSH